MNQELPTSIYLHIPFCRRRCFYCDFAITTGGEDLKQRYVETLCQEIALTAAHKPPKAQLQTIFFGGGTPSLLSVAQIDRILEAIARHFGIVAKAEISLEANPGTIALETAAGYHASGVNRISLGAQAFQQELLDVCGRGHSVEEIYTAVDVIQKAGIANFSLDLISGLPKQTIAQWQESLDRAIAFAPTHMSIYDLTIEEGTAFGKRYQAGDRPLPTEEMTVEMYLLARQALQSSGYEHYEISNYARSGYQCQHNRTYWLNQPFYGVGMGATSYLDRERIDRPRKIREYFEMVEAWQQLGKVPFAPKVLDVEELLDLLMQGLRLSEGLSLQSLTQRYGKELSDRVCELMEPYLGKKWASLENGYLKLIPPDGWLFSNEIITDLFEKLG
ncbi:radical SAM family heme chaperone HemW [Tumidithrix elongata RA019]|uniref:Heme chaperone HemW n=1 Tax=Tumidithrix elongata BACA0141 TaxID=2716417 RepID=A0AAW9PY54_9CYAN|nr:radical SAM family heme chaperone HemW [Tumidithrix elongata RA019]